jgi:membrane fusion protein, multidrug efflux system
MRKLLFIQVTAVLLLSSCRNEKPSEKPQPLTSVKITEVSPGEVSIPVHSSGILMSSEEMKLSFKTGGIVQQISADEGEKVKKGDVLATLNLSEINAQVELAKSGYDKALRDHNRAKNLYADSVATLEQLQNSLTALSVAGSNLDIARFNLMHSKIIAPDNGVILKQFVKPNELVAPGYPVFLFGTSGRNWKVKTGLSDRDIVKINIGDSAVVTMDAWPGVRFPAVVEQVGEMANPLTGTYDAELLVNDMGYRLATGFVTGTDIFPSDKKSFLLVPVGSIVEADGLTGYIFGITDSATVKKIRVTIMAITGSMAAVKSDDKDIVKIVTAGAAYLRDGEKVRIVK